ncbi:MAG: beta-ketoacyl synthase N-terminal-like domain-containing protein, partial [Thermoanaerobaculia bacterium]
MASRGLVTGTGAVSPLGRSSREFWNRLRAGESAIRPLSAEERGDLQATHVARYDGFSPQPEIPAMKARRLDRGSQFALIACMQAVAEAGYAIAPDPESIGIAMGTGSAGAGALTEFLRVLLLESPEAAPPFHFPNTVANAPASQVSIELKIYGPNVTITQKDPSGLNALLFSALALGSGRAKAMLVGAVDEWNAFYAMGFDRVGALRGERRDSGIVQGEGAFVILIEEEEAARARGAAPLA